MHLIYFKSPGNPSDTTEALEAEFVREEGRRRVNGFDLSVIFSRKVYASGERSLIRIISDAPPETFIIATDWDAIASYAGKLKEALLERQHHGVVLVCLRPYIKLDPRLEETWLNLFFLDAGRKNSRSEKKEKAQEAYRKEAKVEITEKVIRAYMKGGKSIPAIAETMEISESTVRRILKKNTAVKIVEPKKKGAAPHLPSCRRYDAGRIKHLAIEEGSILQTAIKAYLQSRSTDRTRLLTVQSFHRFFNWHKAAGGKAPSHPDDIRPIDIQNYKSNLEENYRQTTLATHLHHIKGLFKFCIESAATQKTPFAAVKIPRPSKATVTHEPLEREDIQKLMIRLDHELKACEEANDYDLSARMNVAIRLSIATGGRVSSVLNIKVSDIKFKKDRVEIKIYLKGGREHIVVLGPKMSEYLSQYIHTAFKGKDEPEAYLIFRSLDQKFDPMTYDNFRIMLIRLGKRAGIKSRVTSHRFRASFATHNKEDGMDEDEIQKRLGHRHRGQTQKYFVLAQKPFDPKLEGF